MDNSILQTYNGLIRFYDGTVIAIEDQEYSPDGLYNWEKIFNPYDHISTLDGVTTIGGHKYKRVKHSGDTNFQLPYRIVPEEPLFRVQDMLLQFKLETEPDTAWQTLLDLNTLKGADGSDGAKGIPGEGWHINLYGYYQLRPACTSGLVVNGCNTCNPGSSSSAPVTFLSLGDGVLVLTSALILAGQVVINAVTYTHFSNDLVVWTPISGGIVDFQARYLATNGTGAVYVDMYTQNYYGTMGTVYVCADGRWVVLSNVATPSYMVGETSGSTNIGFLDNFVDLGDFDTILQTVTIDSGKLVLIQGSIDNTAFDANVAGYGLNYVLGTPLEVVPADFVGFGLSTYTADSDSEVKIQVLLDALLGDGLAVQAAAASDGETRHLGRVDITDLINNNSGLIAVVQGDTFNDLVVNLGDGLILDGGTPQGITIDADNLTLVVDSASLRVKPYANNASDGIQVQHLNPNIANTNSGMRFDPLTGLYVGIDALTIGYTGAGLLRIIDGGVTGAKLNQDVANEDYGIELISGALRVKVDSTSVGFNASGELEVIANGANIVNGLAIQYNGVTVNSVDHNVTANFAEGTGINLNVAVNAPLDSFTITPSINTSWLDAQIDARIALGAGSTYWGVLEMSAISNQTIAQYVSSFGYAQLNTWYGNARLKSSAVAGIVLQSTGGNYFRLIVDDQGNLDTEVVTL